MNTSSDLDKKIKEAQKERMDNSSKLAAFGKIGSYDESIYGGSELPSSELYDRAIGVKNDTASSTLKPSQSSTTKKTNIPLHENSNVIYESTRRSISAPKELLEDPSLFEGADQKDPFDDYRKKSIAEREDDYHRRWRKRKLSPEREDPFSALTKKSKKNKNKNKKQSEQKQHEKDEDDSKERGTKRTYSEILKESQLDREIHQARLKLKKKQQEEKRMERAKSGPQLYVPRAEDIEEERAKKRQKLKEQSDAMREQEESLSPSLDQETHKHKEYDQDRRRRSNSKDKKRKNGEASQSSDQPVFRKRGHRYKDDESGYQWGNQNGNNDNNENDKEKKEEQYDGPKERPDFAPSGKLLEDTNMKNGVVMQWAEPEEAREPTLKWRLYVFKNGETLGDPLLIYKQKSYLFGRDRKVADIPTDHPSCSKQHAVIVFRRIIHTDKLTLEETQEIKPYLIDLSSTNGTKLNGKQIDDRRYYELKPKDRIQFGNSSRVYVLLHEGMVQ